MTAGCICDPHTQRIRKMSEGGEPFCDRCGFWIFDDRDLQPAPEFRRLINRGIRRKPNRNRGLNDRPKGPNFTKKKKR